MRREPSPGRGRPRGRLRPSPVTSEAERRQAAHDIRSTEDIVIELLRNARDAHARTIFLAVGRDGDTRKLTMLDDGDGIPPALHEKIFEPRVTSKLDTVAHGQMGQSTGRGMALYSIKVNVDAGKGSRNQSQDFGSATLRSKPTLNKLRRDAPTNRRFPTFEVTEAVRYLRDARAEKHRPHRNGIRPRASRQGMHGLSGRSATESRRHALRVRATTHSLRPFEPSAATPLELPVMQTPLHWHPIPASFAEIAARIWACSLSERSARRNLK